MRFFLSFPGVPKTSGDQTIRDRSKPVKPPQTQVFPPKSDRVRQQEGVDLDDEQGHVSPKRDATVRLYGGANASSGLGGAHPLIEPGLDPLDVTPRQVLRTPFLA